MRRRLGNANRQTERRIQRSQQGKAAARMAPEIRKAIKAQAEDAARGFLSGDESGATAAIEGGRLLGVVRPAVEGVATNEGKRILESAKTSRRGIITKATEEEQQALTDAVRAFIASNIGQKITQVNATTVAAVSRQIRIGREKGETPEEIAARVRKSVKGSSAYRAQMIARTESHQAAQFGMIAGARKSETAMQKEWIAAMDERTRGTSSSDRYDHIAADGETVGLEEMFRRTGEALDRPGDTSGSAGNVIHCRCGTGFITQD